MAVFTNQATLSYGSGITNSNVVTGEVVSVLTAAKCALSTSYMPDGNITYIVSIANSGTLDYDGVTITDNLGEYRLGANSFTPLDYIEGTVRYYKNGAEQPALHPTSTQPLVIQDITVPAGGNAIILYEAKVNGSAPPDQNGSITNRAAITSPQLTKPIDISDTIVCERRARLNITKSICPASVVENSELQYTFVIQNSGNISAGADDDVVISDKFDPPLRSLTVELDGVPLTQNSGYTYDSTTGEFATLAKVITVPPAVFSQNSSTGSYTMTPGVNLLTVTGIV